MASLGVMAPTLARWRRSEAGRKFIPSRFAIPAALCFVAGTVAARGAPPAPPWDASLAARFGAEPTTVGPRLVVDWDGIPLADAIDRLTAATGASVFIDRRLDPTVRIKLGAQGDARKLLGGVARAVGCGLSSLGESYYLGPQSSARRLKTLAARSWLSVKRRALQRRLASPRAIQWPLLEQPARLVAEAAGPLSIDESSLGLVPHDRWRPGRLGAAATGDQLTVLLIGFGLEWRAASAGGGIQIRNTQTPVTITMTHPTPSRGSAFRQREFTRLAPDARLTRSPGGWTCSGRLEDHVLLSQLLLGKQPAQSDSSHASPSSPPTDLAQKRLTLAVQQQPAVAVLNRIAKSLELSIEFEQGVAVEQRISFRVTNATVSELLSRIGEEAGVTVELDGATIRVSRASRSPANR